MKSPLGKLVAQQSKSVVDTIYVGMVIASRYTALGITTYTVEWYNVGAGQNIFSGYTSKAVQDMIVDYRKLRRKICK